MYRLTGHVAGTFEGGGYLGHLERISVDFRDTSVRAGSGFHSQKGGRSHLSACHTVNGIVDEDDGDVLAAVQCVDGFGSTDAGKVTVALIGEYKAVGPQTLDGTGYGRSTSVSGFLTVDVKIVVHEYGTSYRADTDGFLGHAHFFDDFCHQFMHYAMAASRTVVHGVIVQQSRFLVHQILGFHYIFFCHSKIFLIGYRNRKRNTYSIIFTKSEPPQT